MTRWRFSLRQLILLVVLSSVLLLLIRLAFRYQGLAAGLLVALIGAGVWALSNLVLVLGAVGLAHLLGREKRTGSELREMGTDSPWGD